MPTTPLPEVLAIGALGLFVWTLTEYCLHRFVFHYPAQGRIGKYLVFMFHGVHHAAPRDKTRLVMPPAGGVILMAVLYQIFRLAVPAPEAAGWDEHGLDLGHLGEPHDLIGVEVERGHAALIERAIAIHRG